MTKNILYIWDADYPWDVRVEKICRSLVNSGHEVHIASRNLKRNPIHEEYEGLHIHRMKTWSNDKINYIFSFPAFFNPYWRKFVDSIINRHAIDLIIVRDLPMAIAGIRAGKRHGLCVIFDMAEDYVSMIWDIWKVRKFQGLNLIVRNPYLAKIVEKYVLKNSDHILLVIEEAKNIIEKGGGVVHKTTIVGNTPLLENFEKHELLMNDQLEIIRNRFSAIYTGGIQMGRGIQTVIEAIPAIILKVPEFLFVIVGNGYAVDQLKVLVNKLGVRDYVMWVGWLDHSRIYDYIGSSKIGFIPHLVTAHVNTTMPNKIYDYMGHGVAVIATDAIPMKRIIDEEVCGVTFSTGDSNELVERVIRVHDNPCVYGDNGKRAILEKYNWNFDEKRLLELVAKIEPTVP